MTTEAIAEVSHLTKSFGTVAAVQDVSFAVRPGEVCGLLGPNGAGKTTTLRMLVGLIAPSAGTATLFGTTVHAGCPELLRVGAMVEQAAFVPHLSGMTNLRLWWEAGGGRLRDADLDGALAIAGLGDAVHRKVRTFSQGMKQRLGFARLLLARPELLILDEPTNGLDPAEIKEIRNLVHRLADRGAAVLLSSHHLAEVEQTCSEVVVMSRGRLVAAGTVDELRSSGATVRIEVDDLATATGVLRRLPAVGRVEIDGPELVVQLHDGRRSDLVTALVMAGIRVESVTATRDLEDVFLGLVDQSEQLRTAHAAQPDPSAQPGEETR